MSLKTFLWVASVCIPGFLGAMIWTTITLGRIEGRLIRIEELHAANEQRQQMMEVRHQEINDHIHENIEIGSRAIEYLEWAYIQQHGTPPPVRRRDGEGKQ